MNVIAHNISFKYTKNGDLLLPLQINMRERAAPFLLLDLIVFVKWTIRILNIHPDMGIFL